MKKKLPRPKLPRPKPKGSAPLALVAGGLVALGVVGFALRSFVSATPADSMILANQDSLHTLSATLIDGQRLSLNELAGKPSLMVNVASR